MVKIRAFLAEQQINMSKYLRMFLLYAVSLMDSFQDPNSSSISPSTTTPALSPSHAVTSMKASRVHTQAVDNLLLLREVVSFEQPFVKGATC